MHSMNRAKCAAACVSVVGANLLSGCAWTLISAADAAGSLVQAGFTVASNYSSPSFVTGTPATLRSVCIELNQTVNASDFVPTLQLALQRRGVNSMVYNPGTSPPGCEAMLMYAATTDWDRRAFSDEPTSYLAAIDLTLVKQGQILVTARYEMHGLNVDRFASARQKLAALVDKMVVARAD
ncbi:hypothetical protein AWB66_00112 [Caballeronia telluris]|uniref:Lipoprotein n=2 Tax=Caballeronia telluris TaxID=326475 RepID=A0A158EPZ4_9BURK|nr:hypothetical protein AWB66_00112 [Caballeronia telluris]